MTKCGADKARVRPGSAIVLDSRLMAGRFGLDFHRRANEYQKGCPRG